MSWHAQETLSRPGSGSEWVSVADLDRERFAKHPWNLSGGGGGQLVEQMAAGRRSVNDMTARIGIAGLTGADDAFVGPPHVFRRLNMESEATVSVIFGSDVRDWEANAEYCAFLPGPGGETTDIGQFPRQYRRLWPVRTLLRERRSSGTTMAELGHPWYSWLQLHNARRRQPRSIVFSRIATHPHFAILRDGSIPLQSAPAITLPDTVPEGDLLGLAGLLNSSAACFWLRYHTQSKAAPTLDQLRADEEWGRFHEFDVSHVRKLPLPEQLPTAHGHRLDRLAQHLRTAGPGVAVLLVAGDKAGKWEAWYRQAIPLAEQRYDDYLKQEDIR